VVHLEAQGPQAIPTFPPEVNRAMTLLQVCSQVCGRTRPKAPLVLEPSQFEPQAILVAKTCSVKYR